MRIVLRYTRRKRPIVSISYGIGKLQGAVLEKLPENLFILTQDQIEQLKFDNIDKYLHWDTSTGIFLWSYHLQILMYMLYIVLVWIYSASKNCFREWYFLKEYVISQ